MFKKNLKSHLLGRETQCINKCPSLKQGIRMTIYLLLSHNSNFLTCILQTQMFVEEQKRSYHKKPRFLIRFMRSLIRQGLALKLILEATVLSKRKWIWNPELKTHWKESMINLANLTQTFKDTQK